MSKNDDHLFESNKSASFENTFANNKTRAGFAHSDGWILTGPKLIHL